MSFKVINESFTCLKCNHQNPPLPGSCRNHCQKCLYSRHLDKDNPGDRLSTCQKLMTPTKVYQNSKKGWMILHKCQKCHKEIPNKSAPDDNFDQIIILSQL